MIETASVPCEAAEALRDGYLSQVKVIEDQISELTSQKTNEQIEYDALISSNCDSSIFLEERKRELIAKINVLDSEIEYTRKPLL